MKTNVKIDGKTVEIELTEEQINQLQKAVEPKSRIPKSVEEVEGRRWFTGAAGKVNTSLYGPSDSWLSTKERAEAFLALMQLREIHAAIEQMEGGKGGHIDIKSDCGGLYIRLWFESKELRDEFEALHAGLIEKVRGI